MSPILLYFKKIEKNLLVVSKTATAKKQNSLPYIYWVKQCKVFDSARKKKKMMIIQPIRVILNTMWNLIAHFYAAKVGNGNYQGVHGVFFGTMRPCEERILIINDALFLLKSIHKCK